MVNALLIGVSMCLASTAKAQDLCPTVEIIGSPGSYDIGEHYQITVKETAYGSQNGNPLVPTFIKLYGCSGTQSAPLQMVPSNGPSYAPGGWKFKGEHWGSSNPLTKTWSQANYIEGHFWWVGRGEDSYTPTSTRWSYFSPVKGPFSSDTNPVGP